MMVNCQQNSGGHFGWPVGIDRQFGPADSCGGTGISGYVALGEHAGVAQEVISDGGTDPVVGRQSHHTDGKVLQGRNSRPGFSPG